MNLSTPIRSTPVSPLEECDMNLLVTEELNRLETYKNLFGISMSKSLATERQMLSGSRRLFDRENTSLLLLESSTGQLGRLYNQDFMGNDDMCKKLPLVHENL